MKIAEMVLFGVVIVIGALRMSLSENKKIVVLFDIVRLGIAIVMLTLDIISGDALWITWALLIVVSIMELHNIMS